MEGAGDAHLAAVRPKHFPIESRSIQLTSRIEMACSILESGYSTMMRNVENVTLEEALFIPPGGYRSILGTLKHAAGWSHVYRSYAFDPNPKHWRQIDWPRGLRDTIVPTAQYLREVIDWFKLAHEGWMGALGGLSEAALEENRPLHWGDTAPLFEIITIIAMHHVYHAGELNQVLSIARGEAWEEGEEVEENNISTLGHRVRPPWLDK
jgi:hypothetical protein